MVVNVTKHNAAIHFVLYVKFLLTILRGKEDLLLSMLLLFAVRELQQYLVITTAIRTGNSNSTCLLP